MGAEHEGIRSRRGFEEIGPGLSCNVGIGISARRPLRVAALDVADIP